MMRYGKMNIEFLRDYFPFEHGILSKSLLSRAFGIIDKKSMGQFLIEFAAWFQKRDVEEEIIALDGKRIKGINIHLLHAFVTQSGIVSAQVNIKIKLMRARRPGKKFEIRKYMIF